MEQDTKESGTKTLTREMVKDTKFGLMGHYMKVIGRTIRPMDAAD